MRLDEARHSIFLDITSVYLSAAWRSPVIFQPTAVAYTLVAPVKLCHSAVSIYYGPQPGPNGDRNGYELAAQPPVYRDPHGRRSAGLTSANTSVKPGHSPHTPTPNPPLHESQKGKDQPVRGSAAPVRSRLFSLSLRRRLFLSSLFLLQSALLTTRGE